MPSIASGSSICGEAGIRLFPGCVIWIISPLLQTELIPQVAADGQTERKTTNFRQD